MEGVSNKKTELSSVVMQEVEEVFGRRVSSSRDCIQLSEEIYFRTSFRINPNTLRRFFGLVKADYPPSASTLNILAKYCDFESFDDLLATRKNRNKINGGGNGTGILNYLTVLFKSTAVKEPNDETFLTLVKHTVQFIQKHPALTDKFQRAIAKTKNGQDFYFEQFVNVDQLNSFYGEGLRYYLNEKKTPEAQIFGHSLLCMRAWLTNDAGDLKKHFDELSKYRPGKSTLPFICGRYFAAHLLFADMNGLDPERILIEAHHAHSGIKPGADQYRLFPVFEFVFSLALVLTRHYGEALYYADYALENYPDTHGYLEQGFLKRLHLVKALALAHSGQKEKAEKIYQQMRPSQFYFLTKKTNTILYLLLARHLNKSNSKLDEQFYELLQQTGFVKLDI
jgi:hypothetical protein